MPYTFYHLKSPFSQLLQIPRRRRINATLASLAVLLHCFLPYDYRHLPALLHIQIRTTTSSRSLPDLDLVSKLASASFPLDQAQTPLLYPFAINLDSRVTLLILRPIQWVSWRLLRLTVTSIAFNLIDPTSDLQLQLSPIRPSFPTIALILLISHPCSFYRGAPCVFRSFRSGLPLSSSEESQQ